MTDFLLTAAAADQLAWLHALHVAVDDVLRRVPATKVIMSGEGWWRGGGGGIDAPRGCPPTPCFHLPQATPCSSSPAPKTGTPTTRARSSRSRAS